MPPSPVPARRSARRQPRPWFGAAFGRVYDRQVDGLGLGVFRAVFGLVLLAEVLHLFYFRHLVFDVVPYLEMGEIGFTTPLLLWAAVLGLLVLGWHTRAAALANYGFCLVFFASLKTYSYMITPVYIGMSLLLLVLPVGRRFSLDRLLLKLRHTGPGFRYQPPGTVSQLAYYVPVVVGIAFVYLDSTLYKLTSPMWLAGLGLWKTLSLPYETPVNGSLLLNQQWLVKSLGYFTLVFEFLFLFLFPFRKYRLGLLLIGVGLHASILVFFAFPLFALGFLSIYLLLLPANLWQRLLGPRAGRTRLTLYFDPASGRSARLRVLVEHFDRRGAVQFRPLPAAAAGAPVSAGEYGVNAAGRRYLGSAAWVGALAATGWLWPLATLLRLPGLRHLARAAYRFGTRPDNRQARAHGVLDAEWLHRASAPPAAGPLGRRLRRAGAAAGLLVLTGAQCLVSYQTPLIRLLRRNLGLDATLPGRALAAVATASTGPAHHLLGITTHPIALDEHFAGYTRLVAVTYTGPDGTERFLPITRPSGQPGPYLSGAVWLKWTYYVVSGKLDRARLEKGLRSFTAFWAHHNGVDLRRCRFRVKVKKIAEAHSWQRDFLNQQLVAPWQDAGTVEWRDYECTPHLADIKAL